MYLNVCKMINIDNMEQVVLLQSEKASSRKRPAPDSDAMATASPVKRPAKPPVHGA